MKTVRKNQFNDMMAAILKAGKTLIAPISDGTTSMFAAITDPAAARLDIAITKLSLKDFFLPKTECLLKYETTKDGVTIADPEMPGDPRVVFGARPCDAAALDIMDKVFTWDYNDTLYLKRRELTTIVSIGCASMLPSCHCIDVGYSPDEKSGSDVILTPVGGDVFAVQPLTGKGNAIAALWTSLMADASAAEQVALAKREDSFAAKEKKYAGIGSTLKEKMESPQWAAEAMKCLGCGACAFTCPTCHCFDIVDENGKNGHGCRRRNWDSCAFGTFTRHGSGHNPRGEQWQRYRQRVMHKFDYYPEKFGVVSCVGCGRCVIACPVGMDIFQIIEKVTESK